MSDQSKGTLGRVLAFVLVALVVMIITAAVTALLFNIHERKQEARDPYLMFVKVDEDTVDPAVWGTNWPRQYDGYLRTAETTPSRFGGAISEGALPPQKAELYPWLTRIFAGYLFAIDYRGPRGHAFMLADQMMTKRNLPGRQSGNCLHCHASSMPLYRKLGSEALPEATRFEQEVRGMELAGDMEYWDAHGILDKHAGAHPVSCVDCHSPENMELRVTRPAFILGIQALAEGDAPTPHLPSIERWREGDRSKPYDPNTDGFRQEMRSYVCAQCHVEYYCGKGTTIFYPWNDGLKMEEQEAYYNQLEIPRGQRFRDWVHTETGMDLLKAQHPEFETWSMGVHAASGVSCADCHMPYKREGAMKVSEHWVRSPLVMVNRSCMPCHPFPEQELINRVTQIQDRHKALKNRAGNAAVDMIDAIVAVRRPYDDRHREQAIARAREALASDPSFAALPETEQQQRLANATRQQLQAMWREVVKASPELTELGELQRKAQWRLDYVASENSMGFHAPQDMARILGESLDYSRQAQAKALEIRSRQ